MNNELVTTSPESRQITPMDLLQSAQLQKADVATMRELWLLQKEWEADQARKAFSVAFSEFKAESIRIVKNIAVSDGPLKGKKYADLFGVTSVLTPILSKYGLGSSWKLSKDEQNWIEVTCTIRHIQGHSESVSMGAEPDKGPGRNAIQARMSTVSYLERYTLLAATGMAAAGTDDDGNGNGKQPGKMEEKDYINHLDNIRNAGSIDELKRIYLLAAKEADVIGDRTAAQAFVKAKNVRFREVTA